MSRAIEHELRVLLEKSEAAGLLDREVDEGLDPETNAALCLLRLIAEGISPDLLLQRNHLHLACGSGNRPLAEEVAAILNTQLDTTMHPSEENPAIRRFKDGEARPVFSNNLKGQSVFIMQSPSPAFLIPDSDPPKYTPGINDHLMELFLMIDAARRADVGKIVVVLPYHAYARQDRKSQPKEPISVAVIDKTIESLGADVILTVDLHSKQSTCSVMIPYPVVHASYVLVPWIKEHINLQNLTVVSPDIGGVRMGSKFAHMIFGIKKDIGFTIKIRDPVTGKIVSFEVVGGIEGRDVLIVDDIIASGSTLCACIAHLKEQGARRIYVVVAHGLFLGDCLQKLLQSPIEFLTVTDTIEQRPEIVAEAEKANGRVNIVGIAPLLAEGIRCVYTGEDMGHLFHQG